MLLAHHCLLRTSELCKLTFENVLVDRNSGVLRLLETKSGQRLGCDEGVVITDSKILGLLRWIQSKAGNNERVMGLEVGAFRRLFSIALDEMGLTNVGFKPYSLRRGGATSLFRSTRNLPYVVVRGRWASARTARIYILEAVASLTQQKLSDNQHDLFTRSVDELSAFAEYISKPERGCVEGRARFLL